MNKSEIETTLRHAPTPPPPPGLKERLQVDAPKGRAGAPTFTNSSTAAPTSWLARWWPALASTAVSLAFAAVLTAQQVQIRELQHSIQAQPAAAAVTDSAPSSASSGPEVSQGNVKGLSEQNDIARLRAEVARLNSEIAKLEDMQLDNKKLREQIAANSALAVAQQATQDSEAARQKALNAQCVNNLKQLGLATRVWAIDNGDVTPPRVLDMTNEMATPKILVCPADPARQTASGWAAYSDANCSYEYFAPTASTSEPSRVLFRCPIHGNVGLVDGSVQMGVAKTHPEWFVQRDGKLFMEPSAPAPAAAPNQ